MFDPSFLVNAAAEITRGAIAAKQSADAENKSRADADAALKRAVAADIAWANAETLLDLSAPLKDAQRTAAAQALVTSAAASAMAARSALSLDAEARRSDAMNIQVQRAANDALAAPKDARKQSAMRAWQRVQLGVPTTPASPALPALTSGATAGGKVALPAGGAFGAWVREHNTALAIGGGAEQTRARELN